MNKELLFRQKNLIPKDLAIKLNKLGFNEVVIGGYYENNEFAYHPDSDIIIDIPLWQQAFDWFREKYNLDSSVKSLRFTNKFEYHIIDLKDENYKHIGVSNFKTYKKAQQACLEKLIEITSKDK